MTGELTSTRAARTQARLLDGARRAFADLGWTGTRVEDITSRAGVSHGTFYNYFDNKTAVLTELVTGAREALVDIASQGWDAEDVRGEIERVIDGVLSTYEAEAVVLATWLEAAGEDPAFGALYRESRAIFDARVAEQVSAVIRASERVDVPAAETVASSLVSMVEHVAYRGSVLGESGDRDESVRALVLVWGGALNALAGFPVVVDP